MFRNYFKTAWRNLTKYKAFSIINIFGLAIGIACCIVVSLFIIDELSYDRQNKDADLIYRIVRDFVNNDGSRIPDATTPPTLAEAIQKDIPEVEHVARLFPDAGIGNHFYVRYGNKKFIEEYVYRADTNLFDVFTIPFIKGNPKTALSNPNSVILTESTARKYFGNVDPIGKTLEIDDWEPVMITAVVKDIPDNAHFKFDLLVPLKRGIDASINTNWAWYSFYTYLKLKKGTDIAVVDKKFRALFKKSQPESRNYYYSQALTAIHLKSNLKSELKPNSDIVYIYIFGTIAIFILLIACMNHVNLTTARSSLRAKEIGIRKIAGAVKSSLIKQFLGESVLFALLAALVAIVIAKFLLPTVNNITGKQLALIPHENYLIILSVFVFAILIGLFAGFYPALYLSSFEPVKVLKAGKLSSIKNFSLRKVLVVAQFTISITLIIATIIIIQQISFIQTAKLGLNKDNVIIVNDTYYLNRDETTALKNEWMQVPGVKKVAAADGVVGGRIWARDVKHKVSQNRQLINFLTVDADFIGALNIEIKAGRGFSSDYPSDTANAIILNEQAVKQLAIPIPVIGQQIVWRENPKTKEIFYASIIGVVKDFHFTSMKSEIKPFAFVTSNKRRWNYSIVMNEVNTSQTLAAIKNVWDKNVKSRPFQYSFLDETFAKLYRSEMNFKTIFSYITFIAIFIACLGLFGLSSFIMEQRSKEIGIRKVLGASVAGIVSMLSKDFLKPITVSIIVASPIAYYFMHQWLQNFAYRINISWWVFAFAGIAAMLIAFVTVSFQAIRAAIANPVKRLRAD
jgi:putative ABC transport system permease protein